MYKLLLALLLPSLAYTQPASWTSKGIGGGGALFSPSINPHNTNSVFVACDMSGLYKTDNAGQAWNVLNHNSIQANRSSKVCFTSDPDILYSIDHTLQSGYDASRPVMSTDGGQSWQTINDPTGSDCWSLWTDYANSQRVIVSDYSNVWISNNSGQSFSMRITSNINGNGCHVAGVFFDGTTIYIGTNAGLYSSTDNGVSFSLGMATGMNAGESMVSFCGAKQGSTVKLFCITQDDTDVYAGVAGDSYSEYQNTYSMIVGQSAWTNISNGFPVDHRPFFIKCALDNINTIYTAGCNETDKYPSVCKSTDGGATWTETFMTNQNSNIYTGWCGDGGDRGWGYAELVFGFDVSPTDATKAAFTDFGFIHLTDDGGSTWKQGYVNTASQNPMGANTPSFKYYEGNGLENTSCWNVCWSDAQKMFAGYSDIRGTQSNDGGNTWRMTGATTQNTVYQYLKHPNGTLYAATSTAHDIYQTTYLVDSRLDVAFGGINYSTDNGQSWQTLHNFNHPVVWMCIDPNNSNTMYASVIHYAGGVGEGGIWKTTNLSAGSATVWTKLNNPSRTEGHPFNVQVLNDGSVVASYCGRRNSGGAFTASSGVYILPNASSTWTDRSDAGMFYYTKDVIVDPHDATQNTWYACVWSGWGGAPNGLGGLYKTTDRGVNWTRIFSGADRVSSITINPNNGSEAWMTTETEGLWHITNLQSAGSVFTKDLNFAFRQPERVFYNPHSSTEIWVTTFGGGIWKRSSITSINNYETNKENKMVIFPNPALKEHIQFNAECAGSVAFINVAGEVCEVQTVRPGVNILYTELKPGIYIMELYTTDIHREKLVVH